MCTDMNSVLLPLYTAVPYLECGPVFIRVYCIYGSTFVTRSLPILRNSLNDCVRATTHQTYRMSLCGCSLLEASSRTHLRLRGWLWCHSSTSKWNLFSSWRMNDSSSALKNLKYTNFELISVVAFLALPANSLSINVQVVFPYNLWH